jgi:hypothetical protein
LVPDPESDVVVDSDEGENDSFEESLNADSETTTPWYSGTILAGLKSLFGSSTPRPNPNPPISVDLESSEIADTSVPTRKRRRPEDMKAELRPTKRAHFSNGPDSFHPSPLFSIQDSANMSRLKNLYENQPPQPQAYETSKSYDHLDSEDLRNGDRMDHDFNGRDYFEDVSGHVSSYDEEYDGMDIELETFVVPLNIRAIWDATSKKDRLRVLQDVPVFRRFMETRNKGVVASVPSEDIPLENLEDDSLSNERDF